jgi:DNA-directed RNA polymerase subunit RPC12/RpoP
MIVRYRTVTYNCPWCGKGVITEEDYFLRRKLFGITIITCQHCNNRIDTGLKEWCDLSRNQKAIIWFREIILFFSLFIVNHFFLAIPAMLENGNIIEIGMKSWKLYEWTLFFIATTSVSGLLIYKLLRDFRKTINESLLRKPINE